MTPVPFDIAATDDRILLEGPYSRRKELFLVLRAVRDLIAGFRALHFSGPCVTIFGSARDAGGFSAGCHIELTHEQQPHPYLDRSIECGFFTSPAKESAPSLT